MKKVKRKSSTKQQRSIPTPLLNPQTEVEWWFLYKLNAAEEKGDPKPKGMKGLFDFKGWTRPLYEKDQMRYSQHYLFASSMNPTLRLGRNILGSTKYDPLGATFEQVYLGNYYYVIWNDQFYDDPRGTGGSPWGHSKGMVVWNEDGEGFVMQVSTPSWPASGSKDYLRQTDGNTLGFVRDDNIQVAQHFFALNLRKDDLTKVLKCMINARVVTGVSSESSWEKRPERIKHHIETAIKKSKEKHKKPSGPPWPPQPPLPKPLPPTPNKTQVINNGGPEEVQGLVALLGKTPTAKLLAKPSTAKLLGKTFKVGECMKVKLTSGVTLISKPPNIAVPPWQMVSAQLGGVDLRVATWWAHPRIYSTDKNSPVPECWDDSLGKPGAVQIATTGTSKLIDKVLDPNTGKHVTIKHPREVTIGLLGQPSADGNHAKFGVSTSKGKTYSIFGDMNQQGAYSPGKTGGKCSSSQNGRGGLFYVMDDKQLFESVSTLLTGESAPTGPPPPKSKKKSTKTTKSKKSTKTTKSKR